MGFAAQCDFDNSRTATCTQNLKSWPSNQVTGTFYSTQSVEVITKFTDWELEVAITAGYGFSETGSAAATASPSATTATSPGVGASGEHGSVAVLLQPLALMLRVLPRRPELLLPRAPGLSEESRERRL